MNRSYTIRELIDKVLYLNGINNKQLANDLNISLSYLSDIKHCRKSCPDHLYNTLLNMMHSKIAQAQAPTKPLEREDAPKENPDAVSGNSKIYELTKEFIEIIKKKDEIIRILIENQSKKEEDTIQ